MCIQFHSPKSELILIIQPYILTSLIQHTQNLISENIPVSHQYRPAMSCNYLGLYIFSSCKNSRMYLAVLQSFSPMYQPEKEEEERRHVMG